jgi:thiol-disulfide isomerase/thioredoxin
MSFHLRDASPVSAGEARPVVSSLCLKSAATILAGLAIAGVALLGTGRQGRAGEPQADDDARARRLIDEVVKTYTALPAYVDRGQLSEVTRFRGKQRTKTSPVSLAFLRPNRLAMRSATTELVCDGKQFSIAWAPFRRFVAIEAPESITFSTFTHRMDDATRTAALSADHMHFAMVMALLSGSAQAARIPPFGSAGLVVEPDRKLDGKMMHSVLHTEPIDVDMSASIRLLIDPDTKLVKQIQEFPRFTPDDFARIDREEPASRWEIERSWTASSVQTEAAQASLFTYQPPHDFTRVGNLKHVTLLATAGFDQPLMIRLGRPAPDFTLTVVDSTGTSRKVSKSDLADKVVVIAYWSMHNASCFEELREIRKIVQAASMDDKVVLVALNVDEDPAEVKDLGARVRRVVAQQQAAIEGSRGCLIAVDPAGTISDLLPVTGLPAVVLLDAKGVVQTSHAGTGGELTGTLAKEIETLLAGESLKTLALQALTSTDADEARPTVLTEEPDVFKKIEELGAVVIRAGGHGTPAEIDIQLGEKESGDASLAKLVPHLKQINQITRLQMQNTRITDAGLEPLKGMSNISSINLEGTAISDRGLGTLKTIRSLKCVLVAGTRVTEDGTLALKRARPGLFVYYLTPPARVKSTN